jgi:molecular chaperone DnaJ
MPTQGEPDYYQILGVRRDASLEEIKQAYHRWAAHFHPDLHPDDPDAEGSLRGLNQAYAILRDPEQRARYDRWGAWGPPAWRSPGCAAPRAWMAAVMHHLLTAQECLEAHKPERGQDLRYILTITPQDSMKGCEACLKVLNRRWCPECSGSRMMGGKPPFPCPQCQGAREIRRPGWLLPTIRVCDMCQGEGVVISHPCRRCSGGGAIPVRRALIIDVPAGVRDGSRLRIQAEGRPGRWGGAPGDLYVYIRLAWPCAARPS